MNTYTIKVMEHFVKTYEVQANSPDEAEEKVYAFDGKYLDEADAICDADVAGARIAVTLVDEDCTMSEILELTDADGNDPRP